MSEAEELVKLDVRGKSIATFIAYEVHDAFRPMDVGRQLTVVVDSDPAIDSDLAAWCRAAGHRIVDARRDAGTCLYTIEKGERSAPTRSLAMIVSDGGLFELLSPLAFALASALEGMTVSIYFQGPAVRVLARGFTPRLQGLARPFSRFPRAALAKDGHVAPRDKLLQIQSLGGRLYACGPSMDHFGVAAADLAFDGVIIAEYLTFMEVMSDADVTLYPS